LLRKLFPSSGEAPLGREPFSFCLDFVRCQMVQHAADMPEREVHIRVFSIVTAESDALATKTVQMQEIGAGKLLQDVVDFALRECHLVVQLRTVMRSCGSGSGR